jgi:hypothetical protein
LITPAIGDASEVDVLSSTMTLDHQIVEADETESSSQIGVSKTETETDTGGPTININLLLTTGARHPYKITDRYLKKRGVQAEGDDPFNISVYTLKELIWREWREGEDNSTVWDSEQALTRFFKQNGNLDHLVRRRYV